MGINFLFQFVNRNQRGDAILRPKETQEHAWQFAQSQPCKRMLSDSNDVAFSFGHVAGYTFLHKNSSVLDDVRVFDHGRSMTKISRT